MVDQKPLQEWLQKHGIHTLNPTALQSISRRLAVEGATTNELDLLWNHALATGSDNPAAMVGIALKDNWRLAVESVLLAQPEHLPAEPEKPQYPGDVVPREGRSRRPEDIYCSLCNAPGELATDGETFRCSKCKAALSDSKGNIYRDAGQWEGPS